MCPLTLERHSPNRTLYKLKALKAVDQRYRNKEERFFQYFKKAQNIERAALIARMLVLAFFLSGLSS